MQPFNLTIGLLWGYPVNLHPYDESNSSQKFLPKAKFRSPLLKPLET